MLLPTIGLGLFIASSRGGSHFKQKGTNVDNLSTPSDVPIISAWLPSCQLLEGGHACEVSYVMLLASQEVTLVLLLR